jgi:hypothetical protein
MDPSAGTTRSGPDPIVVSPDIGPLPPLYVPRPGQPDPPGQLRDVAARAARWVGGCVIRRLRRPRPGR